MSIGLLSSALSGLTAFQRSLDTTSNNIANVNTEGYSRQRVELASRPEQYTSAGYMGVGVDTPNITRSYDQFLTGQVRASTAAFSEVDSYHALSSEIDNLLADESTGLSASMKSFFNAVNDLSNDPSSIPIRKILLAETDATANHFNTIANRLGEIENQVNTNLQNGVDDLNNYAKGLAKLNLQIVDSIGRTTGKQLPNEMLDQRDELLRKVAEQIDISVLEQADGSVSVFIGQGQALVMGGNATSLAIKGNLTAAGTLEIEANGFNITEQISGGALNGNLRFRDEVLYPAQRQLGLLATGIATEFNTIHQQGFDLNGDQGLALFDLGVPEVQVLSHVQDQTLIAQATFQAPSSSAALASAYRIDVNSGGGFNLTNLDNPTNPSNYASLADLQAATPSLGFNIDFLGGSLSIGDRFEISPSIHAAMTLQRNSLVSSPRQIAAAQIAGLSGDNRNALLLADLENQTLMQNGKASFTQVYGQLVAEIGGTTNTALVSRSAQEVLLNQAKTEKSNLSDVNLDEEAANLIQFQNAYQAAAQAVSVARSLFDTLIGAVR
ncbi:MAG: flagellar hook-associated protein FlgK [Pseudomonadota bacterium]